MRAAPRERTKAYCIKRDLMSLTAFLVAVGDGIQAADWPATEARASSFLSGLTKQPTFRYEMPGAVVLQSSVYPDESQVAVCRRTTSDRDMMVVFDGWLENRNELMVELGQTEDVEQVTDSELLILGHLRWGQQLPRHLYGEYSYAFVERAGRDGPVFAVAVSDKIGVRPLTIMAFRGIAWASNFAGALACVRPSNPLNAGYVAEVLCHDVNSVGETFYEGISRVLGGSSAVLKPAGEVKQHRYWSGAAGPQLHENDAAEAFKAQFERSVKAACQVRGPLGVRVSGGVDSSCISVVVDRLWRAGRLGVRPIGMSLVYPGRQCDESDYLDALSSKVTYPIYRRASQYWTNAEIRDATIRLRYPFLAFATTASSGFDTDYRSMGGRVLLNGEGGDELLVPTIHAFISHVPNDWCAGVRLVSDRLRAAPKTASIAGRVKWALDPVLGFRARNLLSKLYERKRYGWRPNVDSGWVARTQLLRRLDRRSVVGRPRTLALCLANSGLWSAGSIHPYAAYFLRGMETRSPLSSAALIELCERLPATSLDGLDAPNRGVLRASAAPELPQVIANRTGKAEFTEALRPALLEVIADSGVSVEEALALSPLGCWIPSDSSRRYYPFCESMYSVHSFMKLFGSCTA